MNMPQLKANYRPLDEILYQGYAPNVISTAMELGLFDALAEEPVDAPTLSVRLGTVENLTEAFANILVTLKLLEKNGADYSLTPISADFLVKSSPAYQGATIAMFSHYGQVMNQIPEILKNFVSNHLSMDDYECGPVSGTMVELMTGLMGYPTHHLSEDELKKALEACGFGDFTVRPAEDGRQYRSLILAARKLR